MTRTVDTSTTLLCSRHNGLPQPAPSHSPSLLLVLTCIVLCCDFSGKVIMAIVPRTTMRNAPISCKPFATPLRPYWRPLSLKGDPILNKINADPYKLQVMYQNMHPKRTLHSNISTTVTQLSTPGDRHSTSAVKLRLVHTLPRVEYAFEGDLSGSFHLLFFRPESCLSDVLPTVSSRSSRCSVLVPSFPVDRPDEAAAGRRRLCDIIQPHGAPSLSTHEQNKTYFPASAQSKSRTRQ